MYAETWNFPEVKEKTLAVMNHLRVVVQGDDPIPDEAEELVDPDEPEEVLDADARRDASVKKLKKNLGL